MAVDDTRPPESPANEAGTDPRFPYGSDQGPLEKRRVADGTPATLTTLRQPSYSVKPAGTFTITAQEVLNAKTHVRETLLRMKELRAEREATNNTRPSGDACEGIGDNNAGGHSDTDDQAATDDEQGYSDLKVPLYRKAVVVGGTTTDYTPQEITEQVRNETTTFALFPAADYHVDIPSKPAAPRRSSSHWHRPQPD